MCAKNASCQARVCICNRAGFLVWQTPRLPAALFSAAGPFQIPRSESSVEELRTPSIRYGLPAWARIPQMKTLQIIIHAFLLWCGHVVRRDPCQGSQRVVCEGGMLVPALIGSPPILLSHYSARTAWSASHDYTLFLGKSL